MYCHFQNTSKSYVTKILSDRRLLFAGQTDELQEAQQGNIRRADKSAIFPHPSANSSLRPRCLSSNFVSNLFGGCVHPKGHKSDAFCTTWGPWRQSPLRPWISVDSCASDVKIQGLSGLLRSLRLLRGTLPLEPGLDLSTT
jgi:hypothetical protein